MQTKYYYSFNQYLRQLFAERVQRISLAAGFSCPNLDGSLSKNGCIYCNNYAFSHSAASKKSIKTQIEEAIEHYQGKGIKKFIAYFQAFSNTYASLQELEQKYAIIREFPQIVALFISTRPDCIDKDKLKIIAQYQKDYLVWIEYGLQTTHRHLLKVINRNHTYEDFLYALEISRGYNINVGVHIIIGLPHSSYQDILVDAQRLSQLDIQGIKFHLLHVLKGTTLEKMYQSGTIKLLSQEEYIKIICDFLERIPPSFVILRLISSAYPQYLIAPLWMNRRSLVIKQIEEEFRRRNSRQGSLWENKHNL